MELENLNKPAGSTHLPKRVGHGIGSGIGKTSARGQKGQGARQGQKVPVGFEGGQLPLYRRVPKHGFTNYGRVEYQIINLSDLNCFEEGTKVDCSALIFAGLIRNLNNPVKLLGNGELEVKVDIALQGISKSARAAIEEKGGSVEIVSLKDARIAHKELMNEFLAHHHCHCAECEAAEEESEAEESGEGN